MAPSSSEQQVPEGLARLGEGIFLSSKPPPPPPSTARQLEEDAKGDHVVILFGWMAAQLRYVNKYATELYAGHTVLIVLGGPADFFSAATATSRPHLAPSLAPLVTALRAEGCLQAAADPYQPPASKSSSETAILKRAKLSSEGSRENRKVLCHVFSNGGCLQLWSLQKMLDKQGLQLNLLATAIDSAPSGFRPSLTDGVFAFTAHIKSRFLRAVMRPIAALVLILTSLVARLCGVQAWNLKAKEALLRGDLYLPGGVPKLFVYSRADKLVNWKGIESVIGEAEGLGQRVHKLFFEDSEHVRHLVSYKKEYVAALENLVKEATAAAPSAAGRATK